MEQWASINIPGTLGVLTGFGLLVIVPIVSMLLSHQRRMAELVRGSNDDRDTKSQERIDRLEREVAQLRQQLTDNILAFDDRRHVAAPVEPPPIPERLSNG